MKRLLLVLPLSACSDAGVTKFNTPPTAELSSHASGDTVREGYLENLRGTVGDANHPVESLVVAWLVDGVEVCTDAVPDADGLVTCAHTFLPTGGEVVLEVRDPEGGSGSDRLTLDVQPTDAPVAVLTAPTASGAWSFCPRLHCALAAELASERPRRLHSWYMRSAFKYSACMGKNFSAITGLPNLGLITQPRWFVSCHLSQ